MVMRKDFLIIIISVIIIVVLAAVLIWSEEKENGLQGNEDVRVFSPRAGDTITSPLLVEGEARGTYFFEAVFPIKITDESGNVLGSSFARTTEDWMAENFVTFKGELTYTLKNGGKGFLVLFKNNPSGLPQYDKEIKIPIILSSAGYAKIKVYFNNNKMNPEFSCNKVFATEREIPKIEAIGSAALWELLEGPTDKEQQAGFFTNINQGIKLQSLKIEADGTAIADFDEQLEAGVGGSCRVSAIRAQITETLKQFPTVKNVVISINGRIEDILQP
ncbi:MAG: hypothetical protein CEN87_610 [Parcubacteria group bacterium Licking1014_1]|nr:MAG: hypothetical protein CEN87_610 [Parcubacteria group bacterium Licking1014_1]